jgi:hypothetical protein
MTTRNAYKNHIRKGLVIRKAQLFFCITETIKNEQLYYPRAQSIVKIIDQLITFVLSNQTIMKSNKAYFLLGILILAALSRLIPHPFNFAPFGGMALLGAAKLKESWKAWLFPVASLWISDLVLNNTIYAGFFDGAVIFSHAFIWTAVAMLLIVFAGKYLLKNMKRRNLVLAALVASVIFFLVSNFGVWMQGLMYPKTLTGLLACYGAGIEFFQFTIAGDLFYSVALFGIYELAVRNNWISDSIPTTSTSK